MKNRMPGSFLFIAYLTLCFLFLFSTPALAYIDPSTTTFVIQAVAGVAQVVLRLAMVSGSQLSSLIHDRYLQRNLKSACGHLPG